MYKPVSLAFLAGGILLIIFGIIEMNSFNSSVSRFFTGAASDRAVWMTIGGAMLTVAGAVGTVIGPRKT